MIPPNIVIVTDPKTKQRKPNSTQTATMVIICADMMSKKVTQVKRAGLEYQATRRKQSCRTQWAVVGRISNSPNMPEGVGSHKDFHYIIQRKKNFIVS